MSGEQTLINYKSLINLFSLLWSLLFVWHPKSLCQHSRSNMFWHVFVYTFHKFSSYIEDYDVSQTNFYVRYEIWVEIHFVFIHLQSSFRKFVKISSFPHWMTLAQLLKIYWLHMSLFVSKLLCSIDFFVLFIPVLHCIDSFSIMKILRSGNCKLSTFVLLPQYCLALLNPLQFNINFRISLSISTQKACWNIEWDWIYYVSVWEIYLTFSQYWVFRSVNILYLFIYDFFKFCQQLFSVKVCTFKKKFLKYFLFTLI